RLIKALDRRGPNTLREVRSLVPDYADWLQPITKDARLQIKEGDNGKLDLYDFQTGKLLASLIGFDEAVWAVVTPDGLFDGSSAAWKLLSWRLSDKLYDIAP